MRKPLVIGWAKFEKASSPKDAHAEHASEGRFNKLCASCKAEAKKEVKKGNVPFGTRPFGRRALPNEAVKQVRAKAPRYGISKSCDDCGAKTRGPVCARCFSKALDLEKGYAQTCGSCKGAGCKTCGGKGKMSGNASAGPRGGVRTRLSQVESHFRTQAGHSRVSKGWSLKIDRPMIKSACGMKGCGVSGNALQILQHKKSAHPLATRIEAQKNAPKEKFGKSIEFKLLDENDPDYHGHAGGGSGYNTSKWVHMHGPVVYNGQMVGPKENHKHFKMGAFTREHSPSGFQEHVLGRDASENELDSICALPRCGHPMSQHIPADDGSPACTGCNDMKPRRNVKHTFRAS